MTTTHSVSGCHDNTFWAAYIDLQLSQVAVVLQTLNAQKISNKINRQVQLLQKLTCLETKKQKHLNGGTMTREVSSRVTQGLPTF